MTTFEDVLARDGVLVYRTKGVSMQPMLHQNRDLVIIRVPDSRLMKNDVALYKCGEKYVLHRVIDVKDGYYLIRGDNTYSLEHVPENAVIGVLTDFQRKGKQYSVTDARYQRYVRFWDAVYPVRAVSHRGRNQAVRIARRLGVLPTLKRLMKK